MFCLTGSHHAARFVIIKRAMIRILYIVISSCFRVSRPRFYSILRGLLGLQERVFLRSSLGLIKEVRSIKLRSITLPQYAPNSGVRNFMKFDLSRNTCRDYNLAVYCISTIFENSKNRVFEYSLLSTFEFSRKIDVAIATIAIVHNGHVQIFARS